ncbi:hypothetical protein BD626DRAFT_164272 [Schizophyllum amplum]|uniref:RING-type E3 ubiquitin transferase n=1 Tax=Schizophyllum amplum TaxID=97359 RepID=A0A550CPW0_9AGAR|nr:hypothetical protein BD626DRAFT_164272 [Auriculariopsis ampla]
MSRDDEVVKVEEEETHVEGIGIDHSDTEEQVDFEDDGYNCSICLQEFVDRTVIPTCSHEFCFECLLIWTEQSRRCPLCTQNIGDHLIHNIRSNYDYQRHYLTLLRTSPKPLQATRSTTAAPIRRRRAEREWGRRAAQREELDRLEESLRKRRWVYEHGSYAKHVASNSFTRYRPYPTPAQFSASQDLISRTTVFLRRELQVWVNLDVEFLTTFIISIMKSIDIRSESAVKLLAEFLDMDSPYLEGNRHPNAEHFAHEVYSFVRSPYKDLFVYDRVVQYDTDIPYPAASRHRPSHYSPRSASPAPARDRAASRRISRSRSRSPRPGKRRSRSGSRSRSAARQRRRTSRRRYSPELSWSPSGRYHDSERDRRSRDPSPMSGLSPSAPGLSSFQNTASAHLGAGDPIGRRRRSVYRAETDYSSEAGAHGRETKPRLCDRTRGLSEKTRGKLPERGARHHHTRDSDDGTRSLSPGSGSACASDRHGDEVDGEVDGTEANARSLACIEGGARIEGAAHEGTVMDAPRERTKKPPRQFSLRDSVHAHILGNTSSRASRAAIQRPPHAGIQRPSRPGIQQPHQPSESSKEVSAEENDAAPAQENNDAGMQDNVAGAARKPSLLERLSDASVGTEREASDSRRPSLLDRLSDSLTTHPTPVSDEAAPGGIGLSTTPGGERSVASEPPPSEQYQGRQAPEIMRKQSHHAASGTPLVSSTPRHAEEEGHGDAESASSARPDEARACLLRRLMQEKGAVRRGEQRNATDSADGLAMEAELRTRAKVRLRLAALKRDTGDVA